MTKITSAIAAALIASASFASVALADEGQYYQGTSDATVDHMSTGSVSKDQQDAKQSSTADVNRGDYYTGANRPN